MLYIEKFNSAIPLPNSWIDDWRESGKKVFGYFCSYIPDELIYAADILPMRIRARSCSDTPMGDAYMCPTTCSYTRCCLELANRNQLNYLDGIVSSNSCDQIRRLYDNLRFKAPFPYQYFLNIPACVNDITLDWFEHELSKFKGHLESNFGIKITNEKLKQTIKIYNESRTLLKDLYMLRKRDNPPISGTDVFNILLTGVTIPKEEFNQMLKKLLNELKEKEGISDYNRRIMVVGSLLDDPKFINIIEDLGGLVVTDSLCHGSRYFWDLVEENNEPIKALAKRYLTKVSCPRMTDGNASRLNFILDLIKDFHIDGVILQRMKFCPFWWGEIFMLRRELKERDIPCLELEKEYILSGVGALRTRIQAFMEVIEARLE